MVDCSTSPKPLATLSRSPFPHQSSKPPNPSEDAPPSFACTSQTRNIETPKNEEQTRSPQKSRLRIRSAQYSDDQRPAILFDMFGDLNITELNFEELDAACTPVDTLLFDATFPEQNCNVGIVTDKIKAEEISSSHSLHSKLSCTAATPIHELQLENSKPEIQPEHYLLSSFTTQEQSGATGDDFGMDSLCTGDDILFLDFDGPTADIKSAIPKLSDSASSESHPVDYQLDISAGVAAAEAAEAAAPLMHAQQAQHEQHTQLANHTHHTHQMQHSQHAQHAQYVQHAQRAHIADCQRSNKR
eukprot:IDg9564t1